MYDELLSSALGGVRSQGHDPVALREAVAEELARFSASTDERFLGKLRQAVVLERSTLVATLEAQSAIADHRFVPAVGLLCRANKLLRQWLRLFAVGELEPDGTRRPCLANTAPELCKVLDGVLGCLAGKMAVYFHQVVAQPPQPGGLGQKQYFTLWAERFREKSGAQLLSVHRHVREGGVPCIPEGYRHPAAPYDPPTGMRSFPSLWAIPASQGEVALAHTAALVTIVMDNAVELSRHCVVRVDESEGRPGKSDRTRYAYLVAEADTSVFVMLVMALKGRRALPKVLPRAAFPTPRARASRAPAGCRPRGCQVSRRLFPSTPIAMVADCGAVVA